MKEKIQLIIFISIFLSLYFALNYFVFTQFFYFFDIQKNILFYILLIFFSFSFVLSSILESAYGNIITKTLYFLSSFWLGFIFLSFIMLLLFKIILLFIEIPKFQVAVSILLITLVICIIGFINTKFIVLKRLSIYTQKINSEIKIVQISDLHIGPINDKNFLKKIVYMTKKINPDYVFITGDLIDGRYNYFKKDFNILKELPGKKYFIIGNHETYAGIDYSIHLIEDLGIRILRNESIIDNNLQIIGIDDSEDRKQVYKVISKMNFEKDKYKILLYHRPIGYKDVSGKIDLMLSGHTHAGQIFPFSILTWLENKYIYGLYKENNAILYVSSGAGTWGPPIRIGSRSEIVLLRIIPKSN
ncbi:MAG: metallophosphoesterase [Candidatus Woesearchaeota archaeon]